MCLRFKAERVGSRSEVSYPGLVTAAHAFSLPDDDYILVDSVTSFRIITSTDFDETHPAGSDILEYFYLLQRGRLIPTDELVDKELNRTKQRQGFVGEEYDLFLRRVPASGTRFRFDVEVEFKSGHRFECSSGEIGFAGL